MIPVIHTSGESIEELCRFAEENFPKQMYEINLVLFIEKNNNELLCKSLIHCADGLLLELTGEYEPISKRIPFGTALENLLLGWRVSRVLDKFKSSDPYLKKVIIVDKSIYPEQMEKVRNAIKKYHHLDAKDYIPPIDSIVGLNK